ncbi:MAG TPA: efflux RND transporter periplasmic adaptor subunit [Rhodospirillales bacterium]|nr:efflux RND transporter periplasmic adaptor subunit [Rhodospirillales bacterium]
MSRRLVIAIPLMLALAAAATAGYVHVAVPIVAVSSAVRGQAVEAIYATGVVEPVVWAKVTPMIRARIMELCKCEGASTGQGEVLARLDDAEERARLEELVARAEFLEGDMRRYARLLEGNHVSAQTYQRSASAYAEIRAVIAAERSRLNDFTIRAPIAGQVLRRDGEVGEIVDSDDVLFWVGEPKPLWIIAEVDEEDIARVRVGQQALIKADAFPDQALEGTVETITPKGDPINKSFRVRIALPEDTPLLIGMTTEINVVVATVEDALLVPADAVKDGRVFTLADGRARERQVQTGIASPAMVQIIEGLGDGEQIIAAPPPGLQDGQRLRGRPPS